MKKTTALKPGLKAPSFELEVSPGKILKLADFKGRKLVLYFYPKDDTPGCTREACDFRDQFAKLRKRGVAVVGVSRDSLESHEKFQTKYKLPFELGADPEAQICKAYGVWKQKVNYGRKYMGIERTTFLIDEAGKILKVYPKVKVDGHVERILEDIATD